MDAHENPHAPVPALISEVFIEHVAHLTALRRLPAHRAAELRDGLPLHICALLTLSPGAGLELRVRSDDTGTITTSVVVSGPDTADLAEEVAALFDEVGEVRIDHAEAPLDVTWPLVIDAVTSTDLGFAVPGSKKAVPLHVGSLPNSANDDGLRRLLLAVATEPGSGLVVSVHADVSVTSGPSRWLVTAHVLCPGYGPSLRMRAACRAMWGPVTPAANSSSAATVFEVASQDVHRVLPIPISGPIPLPGCVTAPAAMIPVAPSRRAAPADGVAVGYAHAVSGQSLPVMLGADERLRHAHLVGRTGTGKSSMLAAMARGIAARGEGMVVLDPHGVLVERIAQELPAGALDRAWLIRAGDPSAAVAINPLAADTENSRAIAIQDVCAMFAPLFDPAQQGIVGPRFEERCGMALRTLAALRGNRTSLLDVPTILGDQTLQKAALTQVTDSRIIAWWTNEARNRASQEYADLVAWTTSKFERFLASPAISAALGTGGRAFDPLDAMSENRIVLVDLSKAQLGETASRLLGFLYLQMFWTAALRRGSGVPFTVLVDEAQSLSSGALTQMLAEGRKFGLSVVVAHQHLQQLDDHLRAALDGNAGTIFAFRSAVADVAMLTPRLGGRSRERR